MTTFHRPRVLQVISHFALGGAERVALALTQTLAGEFEFAAHAIRGISRDTSGSALVHAFNAAGAATSQGPRLDMRRGGLITGALSLARAIRRCAPDVVHLHTEIPEAAYVAATRFRLCPPPPVVVRTLHNSVYWEFAPLLARWCSRRLAPIPSAAVAPGPIAALAALDRRSGSRSPTPRLIWNGVARPEGPLPTRPPGPNLRIVFGGRLEPQKGVDLLPEILAATQLPPGRVVQLDIFGDGGEAPRLRQLVTRAPAGWTVQLHAPVPDFAHRLATYDLALMPSRFEGLPLVAIEAAWAGVPVVSTNASGCREAFPPDYPWLARAGDGIDFARILTLALASPDRWPAMRDAMRAWAEPRFTVEQMADSYARFYREAINAPSNAG